MRGLVIAAPQSGSGKTTFTLGLLRALRRRGAALAPGKAGPDYIDPAFHSAASGADCLNYDPWSMREDLLRANASLATQGDRLLVIEAMMGLFDAAASGRGSAADLAEMLGLPVVLVIDCARMSHSVAALARGFIGFSPNVMVEGVILNRVASPRHEMMLRDALANARVKVFGALPRDEGLTLPERHLGLVQAGENADLEAHVEHAADLIDRHVDVESLEKMAGRVVPSTALANILRLPPPGQKIAVARDIAFAFCYEHMLLGWARRGAEILFFSPLADEGPATDCDAVLLPGGYPELHAGRLAAAGGFRAGMEAAIARGVSVYGECGGFMVLGEGLVDAEGVRHRMLGALPLETSYATRVRHLGYRKLKPKAGFFWDMPMRAHEFHYSTIVREGAAERLFEVADAQDNDLGEAGLRCGAVSGSFIHVIDRAD
ncbi:hydrogenobyrinic acid a,c-diamide synthase (glutamine-hydrolysing) /cobyrinate a,c-diamide synthase [Hoeflea marina]|uniref:Hydrogenobyrinate a,c-diamide synthase n=1 Tax=Hoeflea marina TaxID=274592 RepID=A0A317PFY2_9HYPH|nr:cobyrinate a,c-diamide synthase [Hoeflea marina]PWV98965.1 hydrogenobyrinic acid a,c-diamide synthase (glutamine-hydrolysing) /cobyrinate a,c-diamide synthase [Hoeflea marina]